MKTRFSKLIGQTDVKKKFDFYLDAQNSSQRFPFLLLTGAKGMGKTEFASEASRSILGKDGHARPFIEINCGTIKNAESFFEQVFAPAIQNKEITVFLDECHALPKELMTVLLTAFNSEKNNTKQIAWKDGMYEFDFRKQSYMLATTEQDRLFAPLKDRLFSIDFQAYSLAETAEIIRRAFPEIDFKENVLDLVAKTVRGNARSAIQRAKQVEMYCQTNHKKTFDNSDWILLCDKIGIHPCGLSNSEIQVLTILRERGNCSLSMLSAVTGISRSALQRDVELFLLQRGYIKIEGSRKITAEGVKALSAIEEKK
jgi:Holliday junction resolvasome RuvABC ATP-dependent DNA helicase subunit